MSIERQKLLQFDWNLLLYLSFFSDPTLSDYYLLISLKKNPCKYLKTVDGIKINIDEYFASRPQQFWKRLFSLN